MADGRRKPKPKPPLKKSQRKKLSEKMRGNKNAVGADSGRPSEYNPKIVKLICGLTMALYPVEKICEAVGISVATFYHWKKTIPEFLEALNSATIGLDNKLLRSIKRKALGYKINAVKVIKKKGLNGEDEIVNHVYKEYYPPDTRAQEILLRNRPSLKANWSSIPDVDVSTPVPTIDLNNINLSKLDDDTIKKLIAAIDPPKTKS
jgi:hypothetical protein